MSRIHDALRKAEAERQFGRETPESATAPGNGLLETADLFAVPTQIEEEVFPASSPQRPRSVECVRNSSIAMATGDNSQRPNSILANPLIDTGVQRSNAPTAARTSANGLTADCIEHFRTLRTRLYQVRSVRPLKRLLISSALPGEGKTFLAARLAQILAQQKDCRVLLVDGDLRCGTLHEQMQIASGPGVTDFLRGTHDENSVMYRSLYDGLHVIPCGDRVSQSAELLASGKLKVFLDRLTDSFDWLIVDSPATTLISDARILAEACDGVVLVIEAGATPFDLAQKAKSSFEHTPVVGAVLNRAAGNHKTYYGRYQRSLESVQIAT